MSEKVFVTQKIPEAGLEILRRELGAYDISPSDGVLTRDKILAAVKGREAVLCLLTDRIDAELLDAADGCRIFANMAVGFDNIDVAAATKRGVLATNTPGVLTDATSDFAWALLFSAARRIVEADAYNRAGKFKHWGPLLFLGADITGRTLGLVGAGRIGAAVALKSRGFGMKVLYADDRPNAEIEREVGARRTDLATLLAESDFVSLHTPLLPETRHFIGEKELRSMKKTAVLVNTSRGPVIDERALVRALREGWIAAAGLDVYEDEPRMAAGLADLPNAVLAPHIASATHWTRSRMAEMAATSIVQALQGRRPDNLVNPEAWRS